MFLITGYKRIFVLSVHTPLVSWGGYIELSTVIQHLDKHSICHIGEIFKVYLEKNKVFLRRTEILKGLLL